MASVDSADPTMLPTRRSGAMLRSTWAVAAAMTILLSVPLAVVSQAFGENAPQIVVHVVLTIGMLLFVRAIFDFGLPRWINAIGALSAALFAVIFLLQALSSVLPQNAALDDLALWSPRELAGTCSRARRLRLVLRSPAAGHRREDTAHRVGHRPDRDRIPRHQRGWRPPRDHRPESRGDQPSAPVRVASDRRCQTKRARRLRSGNRASDHELTRRETRPTRPRATRRWRPASKRLRRYVYGRTRCLRCSANQSQPACQYAEPCSRPPANLPGRHRTCRCLGRL